jgi:hypothetical protein
MTQIHPGKVGDTFPAIPTRDDAGKRLPPEMIEYFVKAAMDTARRSPNVRFHVQENGWGYDRKKIAPMFDYCPPNIHLPYGFIY